jgi:hypothetical protein
MTRGIALLGPDIDHRTSLEVMIRGRRPSAWVPDSGSWLTTQGAGRWPRFLQRMGRFTGTFQSAYLSVVRESVDAVSADTLVAYWGTEPLADLLGIKRSMPGLKLVLMVLCYPVALDAAGVARQNWMMRRACAVLDGVLFPNSAMRDHFLRTGLIDAKLPTMVLPPCWTGAFQSTDEQPAGRSDPNVIFIGRTDLSSRTIHAADDLRQLMSQLLSAGIELHHVASPETTDGSPLRRPFQPLKQAALICKMASHDASLIAYNLGACEDATRFDLTVPDRLISSVAAGVPLAMPAKGYSGSRQHLGPDHPIFAFESADHLLRLLSDRERVCEMRARAWSLREHFAAERHGPALLSYLDSLS